MGILAFRKPDREQFLSFFDEGDEPTRVRYAPRAAAASATAARGGGAGAPPDRQTARLRQAVGLGALIAARLRDRPRLQGLPRQPQGQRAEGLQPQRHGGHQPTPTSRWASRSSSAWPTARATRRACRCRSTSCAWPPRTRRQAREGVRRSWRHGAAQRNLELVLNLRAEGLTKIADQIPAALGPRARPPRHAINRIAGEMQELPRLRRGLRRARGAAHQGRARQERRQAASRSPAAAS